MTGKVEALYHVRVYVASQSYNRYVARIKQQRHTMLPPRMHRQAIAVFLADAVPSFLQGVNTASEKALY